MSNDTESASLRDIRRAIARIDAQRKRLRQREALRAVNPEFSREQLARVMSLTPTPKRRNALG